jgi:nitrite reductase/ring-hydroxylating ferredoxin subunit
MAGKPEPDNMTQVVEFVPLAGSEEIAPGTMKMFKVGRTQITVANIRGTFYAFNNICLHRAGPLVEGRILGTKVTCSWHAWVYDIPTGKILFPRNEAGCLTTYQLKVEEGILLVEKPPERSIKSSN